MFIIKHSIQNVTDANISNYDVIEVKVENGESSQTSVLFKFYLDVENSDLMQLTAEKTGNSSNYEATQNFLDKPVLEGKWKIFARIDV